MILCKKRNRHTYDFNDRICLIGISRVIVELLDLFINVTYLHFVKLLMVGHLLMICMGRTTDFIRVCRFISS